MTTDELKAALEAATTGTPELSVESAVTVYLMASAEIDAYTTVKDSAKKLIADVMTETGNTAYKTRAGSASVSSAGQSVSYDAKALDALAASSDELARMLLPHRKLSERAGTMRIVAAK